MQFISITKENIIKYNLLYNKCFGIFDSASVNYVYILHEVSLRSNIFHKFRREKRLRNINHFENLMFFKKLYRFTVIV
jgi:hypothetical protein